MKTSKKITIFLIILAIVIASVIIARHFVGIHFQKKFSKYPPPGVIVEVVQSSVFFDSIETFGTALSKKNKNFRVKKSEILDEKILIGKVFNEGEVLLRTKNEVIIAPFKGVLGKREIAQGVLGTESFILTLDDTSSIILNIKVPEIYLKILKPGLIAEVKSDAFDKIFYGRIDSVSSRVDPSTRSVLASITVDNKNLELVPGMLLDIQIIYNKTQEIGVPENSLLIQGDTAFAYKVLEDNTVEKIEVKIGKRNYGKVSILNGLSEGDKIVKEGISKVRDKIKIKIIN
ncbi:efflux RND transporter periplasmic adaptor subunit [Candidatus Pelagibacter communis]|uniref:efflux RND transporter periplasmic adaptor subunit n=1 Tax=Pelagibacter ubique TaxID=198252 RepID=UPI00094C150C|nr:efflux RND transporter periplasmic adaptor subunit [Candidatus Pelagibacter ubique]